MLALLLVSPQARRRVQILLALLLTSAHASITPSYADVHGGTALTLTIPANALPPGEASPFCVIGTEWVVAVLHSATSLGCTAPPGDVGAVDVRVGTDDAGARATVDGVVASRLVYYDAAQLPHVSRVEPRFAPGDAPATLRVYGSNFAPLSSEMHCAFGASSLTDASFVSPTELACASPHAAGPSRSLPLMISLDGDAYSSEATPVLFTTTNPRRAPTVDEIAPDHAPLGGGVVVSLSGAGFSPAADYDGGLACFFGSLQPVDASFVSATAVRCTAPPASALTSAATTVPLSVGPRRGDAPPRSPAVPFTFYTPGGSLHVTSVEPSYGDVSSLAPLRVGGVGFAPLGSELRCRVGGVQTAGTATTSTTTATTTTISTSAPPPSRAQPSSRARRPSCAPHRGASPSAPTPSKLRPTAVRPSRPAARRSSPTIPAPRRRRRR